MSKNKGGFIPPKEGLCYCTSGVSFDLCCKPILSEDSQAKTAQALMRSRYTAFCLHNQDYLLNTWHLDTRPKSLDFETKQQWLGLKIVTTQYGKPGELQGMVEFVARYKIDGKAYRLHERSEFVFEHGLWYYTQGTFV
ncbi:YchJ family metal-binding protein [Oceanospirillaceae bacterium]|jgi:SEC-C motif-containing protein|nr:YchJ family metal-binding protein [Oceanospirillaceae bacterium]MDC1341788.1 YchJ family metal-binding protein [Oceanospirillaceae bacterium]MDC1509700.1 YchJ family metal-binding protein [Oceanospirillaceae bacterium]